MTRLVLVSGKGGTGKSAVAAALGIASARRGDRVLVSSLLEAVGLAQHLGVPALDYEPTTVRPGLWASAVDRPGALDEYLKVQLRVPKLAPTGHLLRALDLLVETAPGVREIVTIGKPVYEVWKETWDLVVADAPPLGQLESYLRAPETLAGLVPEGAVREQAAAIGRTLADPQRTSLVLVAVPTELAVVETLEAAEGLERTLRLRPTALVANRVLPHLEVEPEAIEGLRNSPALEAEQREWLTRLDADVALEYLFGLHTPPEVAERLADGLEEVLP